MAYGAAMCEGGDEGDRQRKAIKVCNWVNLCHLIGQQYPMS